MSTEKESVPLKRYLNRQQGAGYLSISVRAFDGLLADGRIPSARVGRRRLVDIRDLDAFFQAQKQQA